ncbi:UNVERIFIED_CONTAM: movement protein [Sesamum radiatum]|uniref:Movement protein n=1 Tax=Sesamum radiatum TaxID=300843 RepID=A0AAW2W0H4_SESRA
MRKFQVQFSIPGNVVRRIYSTKIHGRIPARRNGKDSSNLPRTRPRKLHKTSGVSLEGSVKIRWDNTPEDTKVNILAGDSKSAIAERLERAKGHISPDCPQKWGELHKFEAKNNILDAVYYGDLVPIYQFEDIPSDESVYEKEIESDLVDLQPSQSNYNEGDRLQTFESLSGFFSRMTVSNKTMERIMRQDSNLSPYDGFRIGGIGRVLNQIGLNQKRHHIIYKVSSDEFTIPMELTGNVMKMQLIPKEEILEELSKLMEEVAVTMKWIHIGTIEVVIKATFKEGIDSEIHLSIMDRRINNLKDGLSWDNDRKEYIEIPGIFKEFAKVMTPDPIRIPRIGGVDIVIKDHPVLDQTLSSRTEFSSRMSFSKDRIIGYKGKQKELIKTFTPQEIRVDNQPVIGRYEGMLEIEGHEILVTGIAGRGNGSMTLGLNFLEDHKPWERKAYIDSGSGICTAKPGVFPKKAMEILPVIA